MFASMRVPVATCQKIIGKIQKLYSLANYYIAYQAGRKSLRLQIQTEFRVVCVPGRVLDYSHIC